LITMVERKARTYNLRESTIGWVDEFAKENDADKREVVERAIRVYAIKMKRGDWTDSKWGGAVDKHFEELD